MTNNQDTWPAGATWVFQGTIAEDATGGTHVCTVTITPGAGNEMQVLGGTIVVGNTATAQAFDVRTTDGTNLIQQLASGSFTSALGLASFPTAKTNTLGDPQTAYAYNIPVSGTMQLILKVSTAAISVTQTFSVTCRIKGAMPTVVLLDTVGTSTNTINTNKVF